MSEDPERVKCSIMSSFWKKYIILNTVQYWHQYNYNIWYIPSADDIKRKSLYSVQKKIRIDVSGVKRNSNILTVFDAGEFEFY